MKLLTRELIYTLGGNDFSNNATSAGSSKDEPKMLAPLSMTLLNTPKKISGLIGILFSLLLPASLAQASEVDPVLAQVALDNASWAAFAIITASFLTAWLLNYSAPKVRVIGTILAATGCFALVLWFVFVTGTGFIENPRPNQTPLDSAKPALLWLQILAALAAGVALLVAAFFQNKNNKHLSLENTNEPERYGRVSRMLHWSIAILILLMIPMGIFTTIIPEDVWYRPGYYAAHQTIGITIVLLALVRLFWNRTSQKPSDDPALRPWERKLSHRAHIGLYVLMLGIPFTGYMLTSFFGHASMFFNIPLNPLWGANENFAMAFAMLHKYLLPYLLYITLGAHILGALKHKFIDKHDDALSRMVS